MESRAPQLLNPFGTGSKRNNPIFGTVQIGGKPTKGSDGKGYTTLSSPMDQAP